MSNVTFEALQPLVASQEVRGSSVAVVFQCPTSGTEISSTGSLRRIESLKATATRSAKKNMWSSLRRSVTRAVTDALGNGAAGRIARDTLNAGMKQGEQKTAFSKEEVQAGVVSAFEAVQANFQWNEGDGCWNAIKKPANNFEKMLAESPITERFDQGVLARALIELSAADGEVSADEIAFISDFIAPELGTIDELAKREALTPAELSETSETVRASIVMLGWACAMSDDELVDEEIARMNEIANGLGLDEGMSQSLRGDAQTFLFEQALGSVYAAGSRDDEAFDAAKEAAAKMGIDGEMVSKIDAGYRKAAGIV